MMEENNNKAQRGPLMYAILGVAVLIVAVAGSTYAFYAASVNNTTDVTGTAGGGAAPTMTITNITTGAEANGNLIPVTMDKDTLTAAALGYGNSSGAFDAAKSCIDKNGYSACQIYSVTVTNSSNTAQTYDITLNTLTGTETPNVEAVTMASSISVTDATSIIAKNKGICTTNEVAAGGTSNPCYFMVFIENLNQAQTDNGDFTGTVTAVSSTGAETYAQFS